MNGPRYWRTKRWSTAVFLWTATLCLSLWFLLLQFTGCATSSDTLTTEGSTPPAVQPQKTPRQGKAKAPQANSVQAQSSPDAPRQVQQDKKSVIAEAPHGDDEHPRKAKKRSSAAEKKPTLKPQPPGEVLLPPEPSKPPAIGGSGG